MSRDLFSTSLICYNNTHNNGSIVGFDMRHPSIFQIVTDFIANATHQLLGNPYKQIPCPMGAVFEQVGQICSASDAGINLGGSLAYIAQMKGHSTLADANFFTEKAMNITCPSTANSLNLYSLIPYAAMFMVLCLGTFIYRACDNKAKSKPKHKAQDETIQGSSRYYQPLSIDVADRKTPAAGTGRG